MKRLSNYYWNSKKYYHQFLNMVDMAADYISTEKGSVYGYIIDNSNIEPVIHSLSQKLRIANGCNYSQSEGKAVVCEIVDEAIRYGKELTKEYN